MITNNPRAVLTCLSHGEGIEEGAGKVMISMFEQINVSMCEKKVPMTNSTTFRKSHQQLTLGEHQQRVILNSHRHFTTGPTVDL